MQRFSADRVRCYPGPLAVEEALVQWVDDHRARTFDELAAPLRIVVPSRSLRRHVLAALPRRLGALAGVVVQTHRAVAREVVETCGLPIRPSGNLVQELLIRRFAAQTASLSDALEDLEDGYSAAVASVRDLLDAGIEIGHQEAALDAIDTASLSQGLRERSQSLIQVACACARAQDELEIPGPSSLLVEATALLRVRGTAALACRGMLLHGFADATGRVADLLQALFESLGAEIVLDHPPDPANPDTRDSGWRFTSRVVDRIGGVGAAETIEWTSALDEPPSFFVATTEEQEIRGVATRVRHLLDAGEEPERIALVTRAFDEPVASGIRRHFGRLGIALSGEGATVQGNGTSRRAQSLAGLMIQGPTTSTGAWIESINPESVDELSTIELALRSLGARTLEQTAGIELETVSDTDSLRLPVVERVEPAGEHDKLVRQKIPLSSLEDIRRQAAAMLRCFEHQPEKATIQKFIDWTHECLSNLGWPTTVAEDPVLTAIDGLAREIPEDLKLRWQEFVPLLQKALIETTREPLGGQGGGVQVLTVMEARSRTFDHLFITNLNRGRFPQQAQIDPLLGEQARLALLPVIPDMPLKERGRIEERYLFAQLMASSTRVTLSFHATDSKGAESNPSVFIERLRLEKRLRKESDQPDNSARLQTPLENAIAAGLDGDRKLVCALCELEQPEKSGHFMAVLDDQDPTLPPDTLGAFLGQVGVGPADQLWVTHLESFVRCPWQHFLERRLGLVPPPSTTLAGTALDGWLVGDVVHGVLEDIVHAAGAFVKTHLDTARQFETTRVPWPDPAALDAMIHARSQQYAFDHGAPSLAPALDVFSRAYLERVRSFDWSEGAIDVLGAEITGRIALEHDEQLLEVQFRADRMDATGTALVLTDYKTGTPSKFAVGTAIQRGQMLQGAAYALVAGEGGVGRYLVLKEGEKTPDKRVNAPDAAALPEVAHEIVDAWRTGTWFPRITDNSLKKTGPSCRCCRVKAACMQDDSGFRTRLVRFMNSPSASHELSTLWMMPERSAAKKR